MKSDIIYKIGTAEFRKRYIDPAIKSGKITYDYKLRYGTQAFREECMKYSNIADKFDFSTCTFEDYTETGNKVILEKKIDKNSITINYNRPFTEKHVIEPDYIDYGLFLNIYFDNPEEKLIRFKTNINSKGFEIYSYPEYFNTYWYTEMYLVENGNEDYPEELFLKEINISGSADFNETFYFETSLKQFRIDCLIYASGSLNDSLDNIKDAIIDLDTVGPGEAIITIENQ